MTLAMPFDWIDKLRNFLQSMAFALALAAIQVAFQPERTYEIPLRYCISISFFSWLFIDFGRHFFASSVDYGWPKGMSGLALQITGLLFGFLLGTLAGDWLNGWPFATFAPAYRPQLRTSIIVTTLAGVVIVYYFYASSKSAALESKITEAHQQTAEARLKLLETQLEPHMMFNTLANLRVLIGVDPQAAQRMLDHMIAYLRATLGASRGTTHSLQAEFDRLKDYLELMAVRMGPRLRYVLELPAALREHAIPTLLLQPLVENCIKHGLEPKIEGGEITVAARLAPAQAEQKARLVLEISDSGAGFAPPLPSESQSGGFGLNQVRERLSSAYGTQAQVQIGARASGGTQVVIQIPL